MSAKILTLDIESSPIEAWVWGLWDQNIGLDFIKSDWTVLSYAAKWGDSKKIIYEDTGGRGASKVRDDKPLMKTLWKLLDEADIVIGQNAKKFDVRKVNARFIKYGMKPPSPYRVVDTMLIARKYFAFTSQKLKYTSELLTDTPKDPHRNFPGFELWVECLKDNPKAWAEMKKYNRQDVKATWEVYLKLRPWMENHPNLGVYSMSTTPVCPNCASAQLVSNGMRVNKQQGAYRRVHCLSCGAWSREKVTLLPIEKRKSMLVGAIA